MYRLSAAKAGVNAAKQRLAALTGQRDLIVKERDEALAKQVEAQDKLGTFDLVQILLQKTSDFARQQAKGRMEEIVTQALGIVFPGNHFKFSLELKVLANQPVVEYWLDKNGVLTQLKPPDYDNGGGYVDVITLALRLAVMEIEQIPGPLLADEIGKHIDLESAPNAAYFLKEYSRQMGRQIILVTHNTSLAAIADRGYRVTMNNREESEVREIQ